MEDEKTYQIELVWNRETNWCNYSKPQNNLETAISMADDIFYSGDGARVKKIQIIDLQIDKIVWIK